MVRKLLILLVSLMTVLPLSAYALGFGNIKLKSGLNEPLNADISLLSATPKDVAGLTVKLASYDAFSEAGIDRPPVLSNLRFIVKSRANGTYYIHVTSSQPIREPYLDFLLELNWSQGRMLREYTVLLNPPNLMHEQPTVVAPATTEAPPTIARSKTTTPLPVSPVAPTAPVPAPTAQKAAPVAPKPAPKPAPAKAPVPPPVAPAAKPAAKPAPIAKAKPAPIAKAKPAPIAKAKPAPIAKAKPKAEAAPKPAAKPSSELGTVAGVPVEADRGLMPYIPITEGEGAMPSEGDYITHITRKGDKLWNIAQKMRPNDVTVYQMMMALLKSNPKAFAGHNVNRLKAGYVLRIQNPAVLREMSRQAAVHAFHAQTQAWEDYRQRVAGAATKQPLLTTGQSKAASAGGGAAEPEGRLQLVTPSGKGESAGGEAATKLKAAADIKDIRTARRQLNLAIEEAATERRRNAAMSDRLKELEKQIKDMQRLISLKDDELAALQQQLKKQGKKPVVAPKSSTQKGSTGMGATSKPTTPVPAAAPATPSESEAAPTRSAAPTAMTTPSAAGMTGGNGTPPAPSSVSPHPPAHSAKPHVQEPPAISEPPPHVPWWRKILKTVSGLGKGLGKGLGTSPLLMAGGAVVLIVLLLLLLIVARRRKKGYGFQESILTGEGGAAAGGGDGSATAAQASEESSFLSDFAVSGVNAIQTEDNEVDPVTEADVYMAYGRHQQAEELLTEALKTAPKRKELKLKLLELYHATKNKARFEEVAEDLYSDLGNDNDPMWAKVVSMGTELAPDNPLFSGSPGAGAPASPGLSKDEVMDIGLDTGAFQLDDIQGGGGAGSAAAAPAAAPSDAGLDFDFDLGGGETATEAATETAADDGGLDFNLDFAQPAAAAAPAAPEQPTETAAHGGDLDFSLDFDTGATETPTAQEADTGLELDLGSESGSAKEDEALDFDIGGLDLGGTGEEDFPPATDTEVDIGASRSDATKVMDLNLDAGDVASLDAGGDLDEVGTKLDLAKAYIDMGDPEGARSILDEVMDEGNDSQKQEAQELMTQIA